MMKRIALFFIGLVLWMIAGAAFAVSPTGGTIAASARTNTTVLVKISTAPTAVDSVFVCYIVSGSTDTTFAAQIDTTYTSKMILSLPPGQTAAWFLLTRQGAGAATAISDKDTLTTYSPEIEATPNTTAPRLNEKMIRAVSWRPASVLTSFTVNGSTGADSSGHYNLWKNNSFVFTASQAGDSVKVMAYFAYGYRDMTQTGDAFGFTAYKDSVNISTEGVFQKTITTSTVFGVMYIKFQGYAGNGKNSAIEVYAIRDRY